MSTADTPAARSISGTTSYKPEKLVATMFAGVRTRVIRVSGEAVSLQLSITRADPELGSRCQHACAENPCGRAIDAVYVETAAGAIPAMAHCHKHLLHHALKGTDLEREPSQARATGQSSADSSCHNAVRAGAQRPAICGYCDAIWRTAECSD